MTKPENQDDLPSRNQPEEHKEKAEPQDPEFLAPRRRAESRSWTPWIVATVIIILVILALVLFSRRPSSIREPGMAQLAPYASSLPISQVLMSGATSLSGMEVTYIDGQIANTGNQTVSGITVQIGFRGFRGNTIQWVVMPLTLIRTREPYIDVEPVSAAPLKPGDHKAFRLILDSVPADWNDTLPEIRIIRTESR